MNFDAMTLARARLALRNAIRTFLFDPNVNLIGMGYPEHAGQIAENELAIRVHVKQKLAGPALEAATEAGRTPSTEIGGFPTDVLREPGCIMAIGGRAAPTEVTRAADRSDAGGISISDEFHMARTRRQRSDNRPR
jgi:hypothetical protein